MDTAKTITHLGLCAGYGGIELGLKRVIPTLRSVALCEIEAFAIANLVSKMEAGLMDPAPIWPDLKTFPWESFRDRVDILTGGYPCQPFSAAGKRLGTEDPRHLWPFIADGIRILRPKLCFFENVEGHISLGLREVIGELESMGYKVSWGIFSASECGAPHQRKRVFILANINDSGLEGCLSTRVLDSFRREESSNGHFGSSSDNGSELANTDNSRGRENKQSTELWSGGIKQPSSDSGRIKSGEIEKGSTQSGEAMANTDSIGGTRSGDELGMSRETRQGRENIAPNCFVSTMWPSRPGEPQYGWEPPRVVNSASARQQAQRSEPNGEWGQGSTSESGQLADSNATGREDWSEQCGRECPPSGEGISSIGGCGAVPEAGELADSHRLDRSAQTEGREHDRQVGPAGESMGDTAEQGRKGSGRQDDSGGSLLRSSESDGSRTNRSMESEQWQTQSTLGQCFDESSSILDETLTLNPYGDNVYGYENLSKKRRAREILFDVWTSASSEAIQWTIGGLQCLLAEKVLQSGMQLDSFTQRICYFIWCIQTGYEAQGWGLHGMWVYETCGNSSQGQKPIEQLQRELGYAMCQLSYEIALARGQGSVEEKSIVQGMREASERAWVLSEALPEMEEVWRSTLDQTVWEKGCYIEATSIGNRTDELRLLGNGVVPATAALAFRTLMNELCSPPSY